MIKPLSLPGLNQQSTTPINFVGSNFSIINRTVVIQVLKWDETRFHIPSHLRQKKLPKLLSVEEVNHLLKAAPNIKHRALLMTIYGGGLRVSEVVRLKPHHIESDRMMMRVENPPCEPKKNQ